MKDRVPVNPGRVLIKPENGSSAYYATMTRADNPTQEGTPLNKASLLKDATAAKFGLGADATPDDVFSWLGNYNQHCWIKKKREEIVAKGDRIPMNVANIDSLIFSISTNYRTSSFGIEYADEVTVTDSLTLELVNPKTVNLSLNTYSNANILKGKYVKRMIRNNAHALVDSQGNGEIVFVPADSVDANNANGNPVYFNSQLGGAVFVIAMDVQELSGSIQYGEKEYLFSENPDAYPGGSVVDGFAYQYCGVPYENAASVVKIATGRYKGTGGVGVNGKCSLTFDFEPRVFWVTGDRGYYSGAFIRGCTRAGIFGSSVSDNLTVSWDGNTVSWYGGNAAYQLNDQYGTYFYFAIG